jgi:hypothetical protein
MKKITILLFVIFLCSITGGFLLGNNGISFPKTTEKTQKVMNEADKQNNFDELKDVRAYAKTTINVTKTPYGDELLLQDEEIEAMASEYNVPISEVKSNIDYYNYQWHEDHPVSEGYTEAEINNYKVYCNNEEISTIDPEIEKLEGFKGLSKLAKWIQKNFDYQRGAATDAQGVINTGKGDCWGLTDLSKKILLNEGYCLKVIQLHTSEASNHRALEVKIDSEHWIRFDPSLITKHYGYKPFYHEVGIKTAVLEVYK